ncbi:hypothetical protein RV11_GL003181 [Enterococcus phoeniculicola]|uniref:Uncharacterized protein n=1 Tax=Enterococcus phoeniculicola ATCC BAA-412 TaxID=1158610 RepID=R3W5T4_9ENTE|nr:hypothetical protein [Enterococcus phoeniculicola]EOL43001.1 hypothetical protein UC3_01978 [Enterococcus phoeniculicola ATCC BAA-412]EOT76641.1 hypothetical protein I589_01598 [Enterococcus phoeniculicola ATCC BAA-412]OJG72210.1 hypothetical protein RV11_GL003181 [Enterococcus phoeniculicola]
MNKKKSYWVSIDVISRIKRLCAEESLTEGKLLEKVLDNYEEKEDIQKLASRLETKLQITKKVISDVESDVLVAIKMLNSIATLQNIFTVVEEGQLLKDARMELKKEKNEKIIQALNKK